MTGDTPSLGNSHIRLRLLEHTITYITVRILVDEILGIPLGQRRDSAKRQLVGLESVGNDWKPATALYVPTGATPWYTHTLKVCMSVYARIQPQVVPHFLFLESSLPL